MNPAVLDTDVASRLHKSTLTGPLAARLIGREPLITFVTFGELAKWAEIRNWGQHRREELANWLSRIGQGHAGRGLLPHPWHPGEVSHPERAARPQAPSSGTG